MSSDVSVPGLDEPGEINERYLIRFGRLKPGHERKRQAEGLAESVNGVQQSV